MITLLSSNGSVRDQLAPSDRPTLNAFASCVLAEMCAGEPVFAGPSWSSAEGPSGVGGKSSWLEGAAELSPALRRTIRALTHPDPDKVGIACRRHLDRTSSPGLCVTPPPKHGNRKRVARVSWIYQGSTSRSLKGTPRAPRAQK